MREVKMNDDLVEEMFIYLENKVKENIDSSEEAELYEEIMFKGTLSIKHKNTINYLFKELNLHN